MMERKDFSDLGIGDRIINQTSGDLYVVAHRLSAGEYVLTRTIVSSFSGLWEKAEGDQKLTNGCFNERHPELREGEFFFTNLDVSDYYLFHSLLFPKVEDKSRLRSGCRAYDDCGRTIRCMIPIFCTKEGKI